MSLEVLQKFKPCSFGYQLMRRGLRGYYSIMFPSVLSKDGTWHENNTGQFIPCTYIKYSTINGKIKREYRKDEYMAGYHVFHTVKACRHLYERYELYILENNLISPEDMVIIKVEVAKVICTGTQLGHRVTVCNERRFVKEMEDIKPLELFYR